MKLYLALNEAGTRGEIGLHARMAVLSARKNTQLEPVLLYTGERNEETKWFEKQGVQIIDSSVPYVELILKLTAEGRYSTATLGHWLRTNVCLEEKNDTFVLYTDVDVVFLANSQAIEMQPRYFAAAPQFKPNSWNYINAGVMLVNVEGLREDYREFEQYLINNIREHTYGFHDQIAYNIFYRDQWDRLPVEMNWKPYWGANERAEIVHFHGPKLGAINSIIEKTWNWSSNHGQQIGSLFASSVPAYAHFFRRVLDSAPGLLQSDIDYISAITDKVASFDPASLNEKVDLSFLDFRMFPDRE